VSAVFDRSTVTADELDRMLAIIVNNNNLSNPSGLSIIAVDGSLPDRPYIALDVVGEELGFVRSEFSDDTFEARWGTVIAYLERTRE
jgi:hypothetical protein